MARREEPRTEELTQQLAPLIEDDEFLTQLSQGNDPSAGADPLAAAFLELLDEVNAPMPAAPVVEGAELEPAVISLDAVRRRRNRPIMHGLIGAAAATVLLAGSGAAIYNAGPNSPLGGLNSALFGGGSSDTVELASTLEQLDAATAKGDMEAARKLLEEAKKLVDGEKAAKSAVPATVTATVTATPLADAPQAGEPATVTVTPDVVPTTVVSQQTVTATAVVTVTEQAVAPNPLPHPTGTAIMVPTDGMTDPGTLAPPQVQQ